MNNDLISRQATLKHFKKRLYETAMNNLDLAGVFTEMADNRLETWIDELPTADLSEYCDKLWKTAYERGKAEARTKGKWENTGECEERGTVRYICSECGRDDWHFPLSEVSYCWNCGARMTEAEV